MKKDTLRMLGVFALAAAALAIGLYALRQTGALRDAQTETQAVQTGQAETETAGPDASGAAGYALRQAVYPALPEQPDEAELAEAQAALDPEAMGEDAYNEAVDALWEDYSQRNLAYYDAVSALRQEVDLTGAGAFTAAAAGQLLTGEGNRVFSPANLYMALSMLTEVTDGSTRQQLLDLLGAGDVEELRARNQSLWKNLYADGLYRKTLLANSLWLNPEYTLRQAPLETLAEAYYASSYQIPMGTAEGNAALQSWVNENTGGFLEEQAAGLELSQDTVLALVSALYFQGQWQDAFQQGDTQTGTFTALDGSEQEADFLHGTRTQMVWQGEGYTAASLPFADGLAMTFLLPDEGVTPQALLEADPAALSAEGEGEEREVAWSIPKFDVSSDLDLRQSLQALGVTEIFSAEGDFTPLTDEGLFVSTARHAARVAVDEEGCTAAAYTVLAAEAMGILPDLEPLELDLDRPFLFAVTGLDGLPLFLGVVNTLAG